MATGSRWVIDATAATFDVEVMQKSREVPVVLDFWAPWCGPCRQLGPLLETLAEEYHGKFILAKINTEVEVQLAAAFRVESIPWVLAIQDGRPVDQFMGLLPESQIREWLNGLIPNPAELLARDADELAAAEPKLAEVKYREAMLLDSENSSIPIRLARLLLTNSRWDECRSLIDALAKRGYLEPEAQRILSELEVRLAAAETGGVSSAREAFERSPSDLGLKVKYAEALAASQQYAKALETCLEVVLLDKQSDAGQEAKSALIKMFDMLGPGSELTSEYRRKLSTALY